MTDRFFLYARKSSESEERQALSIESQLQELRAYAAKEQLVIVEEFTEAMTAKQPGRPLFNHMVARLDSGDANGIIAWHPDRLARNSIDGGRLIYQLDTKHLHALKFPTFWFENTPQGKFMLQIAFGQSKYYVDNLSENVKRGLRHKLRNGIWPGWAPIGYLNDKNTRGIVIDPIKGPLVRKLFETYATNQYTLSDLKMMSDEWGLVSRSGKCLAKSHIQSILTHPFYYGLMRCRGELHNGTHAPLVSQSLFDQVQCTLRRHGKPNKRKKHLFPLLGLATCGTCHCAITAERQKGHHYYRCTKKRGRCNEPYVREESLAAQIDGALQRVTLSRAALDTLWAAWHDAHADVQRPIEQLKAEITEQLAATQAKLDRLLDLHLNGCIEQREYQHKKSALLNARVALEEKLQEKSTKGLGWLEPCQAFLKSLQDVATRPIDGDLASHKAMLKKVGSNLRITQKQLAWQYNGAWHLVADSSLHSGHLAASAAVAALTRPAAVAAGTCEKSRPLNEMLGD